MEAFEKYVEEIKKDVEQDKYVAWENAYREVMKKLGRHSRTKEDENKVEEPRYKPNHSIVYEGF